MSRAVKDPLALSEDTAKRVLLLRGKSSSQVMNDVLLDLTMMTKPNCKALNRTNDILPFEDVNSLEFLGQKNKCALFSLVSNTKKRPNNLVLVSCLAVHAQPMCV
jgi:hypothetical protein